MVQSLALLSVPDDKYHEFVAGSYDLLEVLNTVDSEEFDDFTYTCAWIAREFHRDPDNAWRLFLALMSEYDRRSR